MLQAALAEDRSPQRSLPSCGSRGCAGLRLGEVIIPSHPGVTAAELASIDHYDVRSRHPRCSAGRSVDVVAGHHLVRHGRWQDSTRRMKYHSPEDRERGLPRRRFAQL
ncbi:hypothetical protein GSI_10346 [Ganoderma sinense ZZ0214-1]|uniref:Uncharacterized protein n=1 Tax=Ganoderma sinense ZZ0214-1 TaxID=1077348 RepID=A0A2G8S0A8_9APHY|nr:hypothetical protein GSI_10346 [Ganoderma sinense ZZ0214-1]